MQISCPCPHCGTAATSGRDRLGTMVRCAACRREFLFTEAPAPSLGDPPDSRQARFRDQTMSRSMLIPLPKLGDVLLTEELICRLAPQTLRWLEVSGALRDVLRQGIDELGSRTFLDSLHPDDRALAEDEFRQAIERGERHDFVLRLHVGSGEWRYVRIYTQARYAPYGKIDHIRCHLKDITDQVHAELELRRRTELLTAANEQLRLANERLKEAQSQLVQSEKLAALGTLAAGMAHEINNPLAFATNNLAVLERDYGEIAILIGLFQEARLSLAAVQPDLAARIERFQERVDLPYVLASLPEILRSTREGLKRVARIVDNLKGFARLDRSELGELQVNEAIDQCLQLLGDLLTRRQVSVIRDYGDELILEGAPAHLNQVFFNVLINALQAIDATGRASGRIEITTRGTEADIEVAIADDGCGIAPEALSRIFDPFFTTKPIGQGTGLGLSIAHRVVADHGGRMEVQSTPGRGTRFLIRLPIRRATSAPRAAS